VSLIPIALEVERAHCVSLALGLAQNAGMQRLEQLLLLLLLFILSVTNIPAVCSAIVSMVLMASQGQFLEELFILFDR